ncbi:MAG: hypothetical protein LBC11_00520 [Puniceicoccales bacterium]|nr:hypothetical protein [Puniceicoccales bacterium]
MGIGIPSPSGDPGSQPDLNDPGVGGPSGEGGEMGNTLVKVAPEVVVPPINPFNSIIVFTPGDKVDTSNAVGNLQSGELNRISDLLDGSNKYVQKCSLNDIMFLVMLILIKSTSEQRESRFESMSDKKVVSAKAATAVYELKMAEAKATYEKEKAAAELKKTMAIVGMCCACLSIVASAATVVSMVSVSISSLARSISTIANVVSSIANAAATIAQGVIGLQLAEQGKDVAFIRAEVVQMQTFFENTMKQVRSMQEAYSSSQRSITSSLQSMQEILEKQQNTRLSVARNI